MSQEKKCRFRTWQYADGSKDTEQWDYILFGEWPFGDEFVEVIYLSDSANPRYN